MDKFRKRFLVSGLVVLFGLILMAVPSVGAQKHSFQQSDETATPTATPEGPLVQITFDNETVNVRSGPGTDYELIGTIPGGTIITAYGKSAASLWVQVYFQGGEGDRGWVYAPLLIFITSGEVPILEPPSTPTPLVTVTIDQTLAAQFVTEPPPTRLATFTPAPVLVVPTLPPNTPPPFASQFPRGAVIILFGILGLLGLLISLVMRRR